MYREGRKNFLLYEGECGKEKMSLCGKEKMSLCRVVAKEET